MTTAAGSDPSLSLQPETIVSIDPATGEPVGEIEVTPVDRVPQMVRDARLAHRGWAAMTLEQLAVMPLRPWDVFFGKLGPYLAIAVLDTTVVVAVALQLQPSLRLMKGWIRPPRLMTSRDRLPSRMRVRSAQLSRPPCVALSLNSWQCP